jgi:hypothetical protein
MRTNILVGVAAVFGICCLSSLVYQESVSAQESNKNDTLVQAKTRYAEAFVKVAEADLAKAQGANAQAPEAVPSSVVRSLQDDVAMAKARLSALKPSGDAAKESPALMAANGRVAFAEAELKQAMDVNARVPGSYNRAEMERRKAELELARAGLEVCQQLKGSTGEEAVQWELLQLQQDVHDLRFMVRLLQHTN